MGREVNSTFSVFASHRISRLSNKILFMSYTQTSPNIAFFLHFLMFWIPVLFNKRIFQIVSLFWKCHRWGQGPRSTGQGPGTAAEWGAAGARSELTRNSLTEAGFCLPEPCLRPSWDRTLTCPLLRVRDIMKLSTLWSAQGCQSNKQNISFGQ